MTNKDYVKLFDDPKLSDVTFELKNSKDVFLIKSDERNYSFITTEEAKRLVEFLQVQI